MTKFSNLINITTSQEHEYCRPKYSGSSLDDELVTALLKKIEGILGCN